MSVIAFVVYGLPQTAGSKRAFPFRRKGGRLGVRVTDANPKSRSWKDSVAAAARERYRGPLWQGALSVTFTFALPRPKGHFGKHGLLPSAPPCPVVKPDVLKLARAVEDALTNVLWRDDSQIVREYIEKGYTSGMPAVTIRVEEVAS